jgi:hypothetical protein
VKTRAWREANREHYNDGKFSEGNREPGYRSVLQHIVLVLGAASAFLIVNVERSVTQDPRDGHCTTLPSSDFDAHPLH